MNHAKSQSSPLPKVECSNCDWKGTDNDIALDGVEDLLQRIDPGSEVPSGECPDCGSLAYVVEDENTYALEVRKLRAACREALEATRKHRRAINDEYQSDWATLDGTSNALDEMYVLICKLEIALGEQPPVAA